VAKVAARPLAILALLALGFVGGGLRRRAGAHCVASLGKSKTTTTQPVVVAGSGPGSSRPTGMIDINPTGILNRGAPQFQRAERACYTLRTASLMTGPEYFCHE